MWVVRYQFWPKITLKGLLGKHQWDADTDWISVQRPLFMEVRWRKKGAVEEHLVAAPLGRWKMAGKVLQLSTLRAAASEAGLELLE